MFTNHDRRVVDAAVAILFTGLSPVAAEPLASFKSVNLELPFGDRMFPEGPNSDAINNNCLTCHSADMVLNQPPLGSSARCGRQKSTRCAKPTRPQSPKKMSSRSSTIWRVLRVRIERALFQSGWITDPRRSQYRYDASLHSSRVRGHIVLALSTSRASIERRCPPLRFDRALGENEAVKSELAAGVLSQHDFAAV